MQIAHGAPGAIVWLPVIGNVGVFPIAARALASKFIDHDLPKKVPFPSNTWIRRLPRSATYTLFSASTAILCGTLNCPAHPPVHPRLEPLAVLVDLCNAELT